MNKVLAFNLGYQIKKLELEVDILNSLAYDLFKDAYYKLPGAEEECDKHDRITEIIELEIKNLTELKHQLENRNYLKFNNFTFSNNKLDWITKYTDIGIIKEYTNIKNILGYVA